MSIKLVLSFTFLLCVQIAMAQNSPKNDPKSQNIFGNLLDTAKHAKGVAAKKNPEDGIDADILMRQKQEFSKIMDPTTKIVPTSRLLEAKKIRDQLLLNPFSKSQLKNGNTTSASSINWTERGPTNVGGRTRALMFDLNDKANGYKKVYAGGVDGGLWYTNDITAPTITWNKVNDFFPSIAISCIVQDPINPLIIYVGTGEGWFNFDSVHGLGVWKTTDGGKTWAQLSNTTSFTSINSILVDMNENLYIAVVGSGIQKSTDGGNSWTQILGDQGGQSSNDGADLQLAANGDIYATLGVFSLGNIFLSDFANNGSNTGNAGTWTNITPDPYGNIYGYNQYNWWRIKLACAPSNSNITYALFEGNGSYSLSSFQQYNKSTNSWVVKSQPQEAFSNGQAWYSMALTVDPNNANVLYSGSLDGESSVDGGNTWNQVTQWYVGEQYSLTADQYVHADHHAYVFAPGSSNTLIMGTDGGIFYSNNANATQATAPKFIDRNNGYDVTQYYAVALHPTDLNYALAGSQDNGTQQYTTTGLNATNEVTGGDGAFTHIDQINPNIQITSYVYNNYFISTDNGKNFNSVSFNIPGLFINPTDYDSFSQTLYGTTNYGQFFRWKNVTNFTQAQADVINVANFNYGYATAVTVSPSIKGRVYFGLNNGTIVRVDTANLVNNQTNGVVLKPLDFSNATTVSSISIDPLNEDHILISYSNYGVKKLYETKNASAKTVVWSMVQGNLPDIPVRWAMIYPNFPSKAIIATELGVWTTDSLSDVNTTWLPSNSGLANVRTDMLKYRATDRTLAAATHGRGMFTTTLSTFGKLIPSLILNSKNLVAYGDSDFTVSASSTNKTSPISFTSSNPSVATINAKGVVHITGVGTTNIAANQASNAQYVDATPAFKTITVLPVELNIKADNKIKFVGAANPPLTFTYSGFKNKDTPDSLSILPVITTTATVQSPIGSYPITIDGGSSSKYVLNYISGVLNVVATEGIPTITSISPNAGQTGANINITGTNFSTTTSVSFGGVPANSFVVNSPTSISAVIGNGASGNVAVTNLAGTTTFSGFNYIPGPPTITSISPNGSKTGVTINITGTNFTGATAVSFGGVPATSYVVNSSTNITAIVGNGASGDVAVTTPSGMATFSGFNYIEGVPTITSISPTGGTTGGTINISGTNFLGTTSVSFGGVPAALFVVNSLTSITAVVGEGASGDLVVTTPNGTATFHGFNFIEAAPTISSISPNTGKASGVITITGTNFLGTTTVTFGGTPAASFVVNSINSITAVVGNGASGDVAVTTPSGTATFDSFSYIEAPPTITSISTNGGTTGGTINITGTNFLTTTAVSFGGVPAASFVVNSSTSITAVIGNGASGNIAVTTPSGTTTINGFNYIFTLPDRNFIITIASVTCNGGNDGKITITTGQHLNYTVTLVGNNLNTPYNFTDSLTISNLSTGTYSLCVTLASQPSYQQCFTAVLTQPKALSVYTNLNSTTNTLQLLLNGGTKYQIKLNDQTYTTTESTYEVPLIAGVNNLQVSTDLACQGIYSKVINLTGNNAPYPQPFESVLNINIGTKTVANVAFEVYAVIDGKKVYSTTLSNQSGVVQLDLSSLEPGIYSLKMILDDFEKTYKIIKK